MCLLCVTACLLAIQLKNIEFVIDQQNESVKVRLVHTAMWRTDGVTIAVCVALVVKLVDTRDLKSLDFRVVPVQVRPGAPSNSKKGALAEWLCTGLQIRVHRFDSGTRLHFSLFYLQTL